jgi:hypothetical protein
MANEENEQKMNLMADTNIDTILETGKKSK